jgi:hypothetical protein
MRSAPFFYALVVCILIGLVFANQRTISSDDGIASYLAKLFAYSKAHNVKALEELREDTRSRNNRTVTNAYLLALYIASPQKYEQEYIDGFPENYEGIMHDLYETIELKQLTPTFLYSFESIGSIAKDGNEKAIKKVLQGTIHSDGVVAEVFCNVLVDLIQTQTRKTLKALSQFGNEERKKQYLCFKLLGYGGLDSLKKTLREMRHGASASEEVVIQEIENYEY